MRRSFTYMVVEEAADVILTAAEAEIGMIIRIRSLVYIDHVVTWSREESDIC